MKKAKKSAAIQIIGGIVLLVLLVVKQIVPMGPPTPLLVSVAIIFVSIVGIYNGIYKCREDFPAPGPARRGTLLLGEIPEIFCAKLCKALKMRKIEKI